MCNRCFEDPHIVSWIETHGDEVEPGYICGHCGKSDGATRVIDAMELSEKLQSAILKLYTHEHVHGLYGSARSYVEGDEDPAEFAGLLDLFEVCGHLFEEEDNERLAKFIVEHRNWRKEAEGGDGFFDDPYENVWKENCWFENDENVWFEFSENVKYKARFFDHPSCDRTEFLDILVPLLEELVITEYPKSMYRVRIVRSEKEKKTVASDPRRQLDKPPNENSGYNRFSPAGISYLYLSDSLETALKETGASIGDECAYGTFALGEGSRILDLRRRSLLETMGWFENEDFSSRDFCFLANFTEDIARPVGNDDKLVDYVPTQIVAEFIWSKGYDGFLYDSSVSDGYNLVLFEKGYSLMQGAFVKISNAMEPTFEEDISIPS